MSYGEATRIEEQDRVTAARLRRILSHHHEAAQKLRDAIRNQSSPGVLSVLADSLVYSMEQDIRKEQ